MVTMPRIVKWHYIGARLAGPDDGPAGPSRCVTDARGVVDGRSGALRASLPHMRGASDEHAA